MIIMKESHELLIQVKENCERKSNAVETRQERLSARCVYPYSIL